MVDEERRDGIDGEGSAVGEKLQKELQSLNTKGVQVQFDLKGVPNSSAKKTPAGRGRGGSAAASVKKGGRAAASVKNVFLVGSSVSVLVYRVDS
ncbi:hypothetical protein ACFX2C_028101 [Malus domestica]